MKKVIMYKYHNLRTDRYGWSLTDVPECVSEPYYVDIPDDFEIGETVSGENLYFKAGDDTGYELTEMRNDCEGCSPYLVGGTHVESIKLKVIGLVRELYHTSILEARKAAGLSRAEMSRRFEIPIRTLENWEAGTNTPPAWAERLILKELNEISTKE